MQVPADAYYGAQTARAVENFPISSLRFSRRFIQALGRIKAAAARANVQLKLLDARLAKAIEQAALEVAEGNFDAEFVVDVFQTGSGTSTNMNANEVITTRAIEILGGKRGDKKVVHPKTIRPCVERQIPLVIKNTFHPDHPGTVILANGQAKKGRIWLDRGIQLATQG